MSQANGGDSPTNDTLTPVAKTNQAKYKWVNHTYSHMNLDSQSVPDAQVTTTNGVSTLTTNSVNLINAWGQAVTGTGIPAGTTVASVTNFHAVVLSQPATVTGPGRQRGRRDHRRPGNQTR